MANTSATIVYPYIVFYEIVEVSEMLDGGGPYSKRMQIDCFAKSYGDAKALANAVSDALKASAMVNVKLSQMDGPYNPVVKDYQVITEFNIFAN